jgi:hypothetical protein
LVWETGRKLSTSKHTAAPGAYVRFILKFKPFNAELNLICHLLALLGAHHILHVSRIRVNARGENLRPQK